MFSRDQILHATVQCSEMRCFTWKAELEHKAITGRLLVILAITKIDECVAYCVCSVGNEDSDSGTDKVGEIDSMFILGMDFTKDVSFSGNGLKNFGW